MPNLCEGAIRLGLYGYGYFHLRKRAVSDAPETVLSYHDAFFMGGLVATTAAIASYPFQLVRSRMHVHPVDVFPSMSQSLVRTLFKEDLKGLYRGLSVSLLGTVLYVLGDTWYQRSMRNAVDELTPLLPPALPRTPTPTPTSATRASEPNDSASTSHRSTFASLTHAVAGATSVDITALRSDQQRLAVMQGTPMLHTPAAWHWAAVGALGTGVLHGLIYPLNVIRRRMQIQDRTDASVYRSPWYAICMLSCVRRCVGCNAIVGLSVGGAGNWMSLISSLSVLPWLLFVVE